MKQINPFLRFGVCLSLFALIISCNPLEKEFNKYKETEQNQGGSGNKDQGDNGQENNDNPGGKPDDPPGATPVSIEDVTFKSLTIPAELNENILYDVLFKAEGSEFKASIDYYELDPETPLISAFDVVASKVEVDGVIQESGVTSNKLMNGVTYRLFADDGQFKEYTVNLSQGPFSGLPVVSLNMKKNLSKKDEWVEGIWKISGQGNEHEGTMYKDTTYKVSAKLRGNTTFSTEKKAYGIKLEARAKVLDMKKQKRWLLISNGYDKTLMRNVVAYKLGRMTDLAWTPHTRYVDLIVDGKFCGNYIVVEQIRVDKNRVDITEMRQGDDYGDAVTGGYLLECDWFHGFAVKEDPHFTTELRELRFNIKSPDDDILSDEQLMYITDYVNKVESLLYGEKIDMRYKEYIDIDSFIDFWIINELVHNRETRIPCSCWMYKDRNGKLCAGPIWDFDRTTFRNGSAWMLYDYFVDINTTTSSNRSLWYHKLFEDSEFKAKAKEKWCRYYDDFAKITDYIDEQAALIEKSAEMNYEIWECHDVTNNDSELPWSDAVMTLKNNLMDRLQSLDTKIRAF